MKDSDPRPMPSEVARAYRDPLELGELFATEVFTDQDRFAVRDELLRRLVGKYGNAEIESGARLTTVTQRVARFKKNPWKSIDLLMSVPEYGGKESVKRELAHVMQPYWAAWWDKFEWYNSTSMYRYQDVANIVLGERQYRWIAAQYARAVIDMTRPQDRDVVIYAIEAAEAYALDSSEGNLNLMIAARNRSYVAYMEVVAYSADAPDAVFRAACAASAAVSTANSAAAYATSAAVSAAAAVNVAVDAAANSAAAVNAVAARVNAYKQLAALTRQLITPTLITSASRGLR